MYQTTKKLYVIEKMLLGANRSTETPALHERNESLTIVSFIGCAITPSVTE